jgi:uncharacterized protein YjbJ (UPF0337 family)
MKGCEQLTTQLTGLGTEKHDDLCVRACGSSSAAMVLRNSASTISTNNLELSSFSPVASTHLKNEVAIYKEHVKGAADKAKGAVKDAAGKVTGDQELQAEGKIDKAKGAAHSVAGNMKDAARDASKETKKD